MSTQNIKSALWGCLEIPLFIKQSVTRFDNNKNAALQSFLIPLLMLIPISELSRINPLFADKPYIWIFLSLLLMAVLSVGIFFISSYICMWALDRKNHIFTYINAFNWMNITSFAIHCPFLLLVYSDAYSYQEMETLFIFLILFTIAYQSFYITHALRINWMLGTAMSLLAILVDDAAYKIIFGA